MALPPIVAPEWLAEHRAEVVIADVRWYLDGRSGHAAFLEGHLPGARWVDIDTVLAGPPSAADGRHPLPDPAVLAAGLTAAGIGDGATVVAYDDLRGTTAGRLVWLLRLLGERAALLDGGLQAWPGPLETGPAHPFPQPFTARPWPSHAFASIDDTAEPGDAIVLDARAGERYRGEVEPVDPRPGHIPGARSAPLAGNLDPDTGRFLPPGALRDRYRALGVDDATDVIAYCGSGVSACHDLLAMEAAGINPARLRLFPGSWSQWSSDPLRPAQTGA